MVILTVLPMRKRKRFFVVKTMSIATSSQDNGYYCDSPASKLEVSDSLLAIGSIKSGALQYTVYSVTLTFATGLT